MAKRAKRTIKRVYRSVKSKIKRRVKTKPSLLITIPVANKAIIEPLLGGGGALGAFDYLKNNDVKGAIRETIDLISMNFSGYQPSNGYWNWDRMLDTYKQLLVGYAGHKIATKIGVNRSLKKLPFVGNMFTI